MTSQEVLIIGIVIVGLTLLIITKSYRARNRWLKEAQKEIIKRDREKAMIDLMNKNKKMATPFIHNSGHSTNQIHLDVHERIQLALAQLQILFLTGDIDKQELKNTTKMAVSLDRENLTVVEEIIKQKLN